MAASDNLLTHHRGPIPAAAEPAGGKADAEVHHVAAAARLQEVPVPPPLRNAVLAPYARTAAAQPSRSLPAAQGTPRATTTAAPSRSLSRHRPGPTGPRPPHATSRRARRSPRHPPQAAPRDQSISISSVAASSGPLAAPPLSPGAATPAAAPTPTTPALGFNGGEVGPVGREHLDGHHAHPFALAHIATGRITRETMYHLPAPSTSPRSVPHILVGQGVPRQQQRTSTPPLHTRDWGDPQPRRRAAPAPDQDGDDAGDVQQHHALSDAQRGVRALPQRDAHHPHPVQRQERRRRRDRPARPGAGERGREGGPPRPGRWAP